MTGGDGTDIFHSSNDAEGDRVIFAPGTTFTVTQVSADTAITVTGRTVVLVGISMTSLLPMSIFVG